MKPSTTFWKIAALPVVMAQAEQCIPLKGSTTCPAFSSSSVSTDSFMVGLYPFLQSVTDTASFDQNLTAYLTSGYISLKYQTLFGCQNINLNNTTDLYARFTTTVICNGVIQNSIDRCHLSAANSPPVCADTCAQYAISEEKIVADSALCSNPSNYTDTQLRADYTNCGLPNSALNSTNCIEGITNERSNCGFGNSIIGLCMYCGAGGQNSTDSCCNNSQASAKCAGVVLPSISSSLAFTATSSSQLTSATPSSSTATAVTPVIAVKSNEGLSGGAIAGIVVGAVVGLALIALILFCLCIRRRKAKQDIDVMHHNEKNIPAVGIPYGSDGSGSSLGRPPSEYEVLPSSRVAHDTARYTLPPVVDHSTLMTPSEYGNLRPESVAASDDVEDLPAGFVSRGRRAPSIAPSEYVILPGGRRVRRSMTITSEDYERPGSEHVISRPTSRPASIAPSERETISGRSRPMSLRKFSRTRSPQPSVPASNSEYEVLPGGRIARKSALTGYVPSFVDSGELESRDADQAGMEEEKPEPTIQEAQVHSHTLEVQDALTDLNRTITSTTEIPDESMILQRTSSRVTTTAKPRRTPNSFIKDYYSPEQIRPGDTVAVVWAYNARTNDEFNLERGDLLQVVGIWDDGWATGFTINTQRADTWQGRTAAFTRPGASILQADNQSKTAEEGAEQEIKAFPMVCVCLADYWRRVVEENGKPVS